MVVKEIHGCCWRSMIQNNSIGVVAYRAWRIRYITGKPGLASIFNEFSWCPGENIARCLFGAIQDHLAREVHCCGLYGLRPDFFYELSELERNLQHVLRHIVYGSVALYGVVVEGEYMYRAEKARVIALFEGNITQKGGSRKTLDALAAIYSVEVQPLPKPRKPSKGAMKVELPRLFSQ